MLRGSVRVHLFGAIDRRLRDALARQKLAVYLRSYTSAPEIPREALCAFGELIDCLENGGGEGSEDGGEDGVVAPASVVDEEGMSSQASSSASSPGLEDAQSFPNIGLEAADERDEEDYIPPMDDETDFLEEDDLAGEGEGDERIEDLQGLDDDGVYVSLEEFRDSVPPYYFKTNKQKRKFFRDMNQQYFDAMKANSARKIRKQPSNVRFDLQRVEVRKFHKNQAIGL